MAVLKKKHILLLFLISALRVAAFGPQPAAGAAIAEIFCTGAYPEANLDSVAAWNKEKNSRWLVATAKDSHQLFVFDGFTGEMIRKVGGPGDRPGQFQRPNGIFIINDLVFVAERDNQRCQVLKLPDFSPVGSFGEKVLEKPYGIYVLASEQNGAYQVFITDDFEAGPKQAPPLSQRGKRFSVSIGENRVSASLIQFFGEAKGPGALDKTESLWADPAANRLLIADESKQNIKIYTLDTGKFSGKVLGQGYFRDHPEDDPEGIALFPGNKTSEGMWIFTHQREHGRSRFHLFDRQTLDYVSTFKGKRTANTDGIWLEAAAAGDSERGAIFYAIHDDQGICAFSMDAVLKQTNLKQARDKGQKKEK